MIIHKGGKIPNQLMKGDKVDINGVICLTCRAVIVSRTRHGFMSCHCSQRSGTQVSVDGGFDYIRRAMGPKAKWIELKGEVFK